jgi:hypothetical protein
LPEAKEEGWEEGMVMDVYMRGDSEIDEEVRGRGEVLDNSTEGVQVRVRARVNKPRPTVVEVWRGM